MGELQKNNLSGVSYPVILRPSDVKFSVKNIPTKFDNGKRLTDVLEDIKNGNVLPKEIPPMEVIWYCDLWEWYTLNNRRLWLFQELEKMEICKYASMTRVEVMSTDYQYASQLFATVTFVIPTWETDLDDEKRFLTKPSSSYSYEDSMDTEFIKDETITSYTLMDHNAAGDGYCSIDISMEEPSNPNANEDGCSSEARNTGSSQKTPRPADVYIGGGVTVHTKSVPENLDVKMECDISPVSSPKRRSRSSVRSKSRTRTSSFSEQSCNTHCDSSKVQSRGRSKGRTSSFSEEEFNKSRTRGRSKGRNWNSCSEQGESDGSKGRYSRFHEQGEKASESQSRSQENCSFGENDLERSKSTERQTSFSSSRSRSRSRFSRSKSVCSISDHTSSKALVKYNSFRSGKDIFTGISGSSFTSNSKLSRSGSLYSANSRYRSKSNFSVEDEHGEKTSISSSRKRSYSSCSHGSFRSKEEDALSCSSHRSIRSTASSQSYQLHKFRPEIADRYQRPRREKYVQNDLADYYESATSKSLVKTEKSIFPLQLEKSSLSSKSGIQLSYLYALWAKRRHEFLHARKTGQLHLMYGPEEGYLCGLCFKKFKSVVDLQQHSEELLHYACVTCGRFFNTYTALDRKSVV